MKGVRSRVSYGRYVVGRPEAKGSSGLKASPGPKGRSGLGGNHRSRDRGSPRSDRGSATVWGVTVISALLVVFAALLAMTQAIVNRHQAGAAADLAALAAADQWERGPAACEEAERVARAQGARLVRCALSGEISDVTAATGSSPFSTEARARAGPPGTPTGSEGPPPLPGPAGALAGYGVARPLPGPAGTPAWYEVAPELPGDRPG